MKYFVCTLAIFAGLVTTAFIPATQSAAEPLLLGNPLTADEDGDRPDQPTELGNVQWIRDLDKAVELSKQQSKPIAILFQEVPGWQGCQQYGQQVLVQPLIVEALEDNFVPVAIYNNTGGKDKQILNRFNEPAWNYQVMRFLDTDLNDVIPRKDKVWDINGTATRLASALSTAGHNVPSYLENVLIPETSSGNKIAAFAMYCFWTGEAKLGSLDGVIATEAGFYDGHEVVVVKYDDEKIKLIDLVREAEKFDCAQAVYLSTKAEQKEIEQQTRLKNVDLFNFENGYRRAPKSDQKRQLSSSMSKLSKLGLTPMQWTKLNSSRVSGDPVSKWLSPRQIEAMQN